MARRLISYMFTSLDGFIADRGGGLDWVPIDDELMRFANTYFGSMDGIVFGRNVYEGFVAYWDALDPDDPASTELEIEFAAIFRRMERIVISRSLTDEGAPRTTVIADEVTGAVATLKSQSGNDLLLVCGPSLRSTLADARLIDRYRTLVAPVALGDGIPLFGSMKEPTSLRMVDTTTFGGGVVMLDHQPT